MKRTLTTITLVVCLTFTAAAQSPSAPQILDQMETLIGQLRALFGPTVTTVSDTASLTAALANGGVIQLQPGVYTGNFVASVDGTEIRGAELPLLRVTEGATRSFTLTAADLLKPSLRIIASRVRVTGVTLTNGEPSRSAVIVGRYDATDAAQQPDGVELDRVEVVALNGVGKRGIEVHTRAFTLRRSRVTGFLYKGEDSQAVFVNNGPGPYTIENNYLEGSGENMMFGGDRVRIPGVVPSDIVVRGNYFFKPDVWRQTTGSVKNTLEFKNARRVLVESNTFDGVWHDAQTGSMLLLTPRNPYGDCPWITVDDVTIRNNVFVNNPDGYAINILGHDNNNPTQQTRRVTIEGNYFRDARNGILVTRGVSEALIVRHNSFPGIRYNLMVFEGKAADGTPLVRTPLTLEGNVARTGDYSINGTGTGTNVPSLDVWATPWSVTGNVIEYGAARTKPWPAGNTVLAPGTLAALLDADGKYLPGGAGY